VGMGMGSTPLQPAPFTHIGNGFNPPLPPTKIKPQLSGATRSATLIWPIPPPKAQSL